ncbi:MAG: hypothetical protein COV67_08320, partial [Nitrospinae bacterium CG11_big_fil_rev_8_21_14_0_20_56_8]
MDRNPTGPPVNVEWTQQLSAIMSLYYKITDQGPSPQIMLELGKALRGEPLGPLPDETYRQLLRVLEAGRADGTLNPVQISALEAILNTPAAIAALRTPPPLPPLQLPDAEDPARAKAYIDLINQFNALIDANRFDDAFALVENAMETLFELRLNSQHPEVSIPWEDLLAPDGLWDFHQTYLAADPSHEAVDITSVGPDGKVIYSYYTDALIIPRVRIVVGDQSLTLQQAIDHFTPFAPEVAAMLQSFQDYHRITVLEELTHAVDYADPNAQLSPTYREILLANPTLEYDSEANFFLLAIDNGWIESWVDIDDLMSLHQERGPVLRAVMDLLRNLFGTPPTTDPTLDPVTPPTVDPTTSNPTDPPIELPEGTEGPDVVDVTDNVLLTADQAAFRERLQELLNLPEGERASIPPPEGALLAEVQALMDLTRDFTSTVEIPYPSAANGENVPMAAEADIAAVLNGRKTGALLLLHMWRPQAGALITEAIRRGFDVVLENNTIYVSPRDVPAASGTGTVRAAHELARLFRERREGNNDPLLHDEIGYYLGFPLEVRLDFFRRNGSLNPLVEQAVRDRELVRHLPAAHDAALQALGGPDGIGEPLRILLENETRQLRGEPELAA